MTLNRKFTGENYENIKPSRRKADIHATYAWALKADNKPKEAKKQIDIAIKELSKCEDSKFNTQLLKIYKNYKKELMRGIK